MSQIVTLETFLKEVPSTSKVLVGGCFDILHQGHRIFLEKAKQLASTLIILLESDDSVKRRKGDTRPIHLQQKRAENLLKETVADTIVLLPDLQRDEDYFDIVRSIKPQVIAITNGDKYLTQKMQQADMIGAKLVTVTDRIGNFSTTNLIHKHG